MDCFDTKGIFTSERLEVSHTTSIYHKSILFSQSSFLNFCFRKSIAFPSEITQLSNKWGTMYFCTYMSDVSFELQLCIYLITDHGSLSDYWEERKLCVCVFKDIMLWMISVDGGFNTMHRWLQMSAGQFNSHKNGLQNIYIMMHVYAIFANCMKSQGLVSLIPLKSYKIFRIQQ